MQGSHTYAAAGSDSIGVTINDGPANSATATSTATVASSSSVTNATGVPVSATEGTSSGTVTVATFVDPGNVENILESGYSASITWGDGSTSAGTFVYDTTNHVWDVQGSHTYAEDGSYAVNVTINDGAQVVGVPTTATVADPALVNGANLAPAVVKAAVWLDGRTDDPIGGGTGIVTSLTNAFGAGSWQLVTTAQLDTPNFLSDNGFNVVIVSRYDSSFGTFLDATGAANISSYVGPANSPTQGGVVVFTNDAADNLYGATTGDPYDANLDKLFTNAVQFAANTGHGYVGEFNGAVMAMQSNTAGAPAIGLLTGTADATHSTTPPFVYDVGPIGASNPIDNGITFPFTDSDDTTFLTDITGGLANNIVDTYQGLAEPAVMANQIAINGGLAINAVEATPLSNVTVATFADPGNPSNTLESDYSATITWGDGGTSPGSFVYDATHNLWDVQGSHTYAEDGSYPISVVINDGAANSLTVTTAASVADVPLTNVTGAAVSATEATSTGTVTVATFVDGGNPSNTLQSDYSASITWGDGNTSPGSLVYDATNNVWDVQGSHTYAEDGSYPISVTVNDGSTNSATASGTATVADVPLTSVTCVAVAATEAASTGTVTVATFVDGGNPSNAPQADYSASITWGDGGSSAGSFVYDSTHNVWDVQGSHTYAEDGSYPISVAVNDGPANSATASSTATVADVPLTNATGVPVSAVAGVSTATVTVATFIDGGNPSNAPQADYSASITWGDGGTSLGSFVYDSTHNVWDVQGNHTYAVAGSLPVQVTIHDGPGNSVTASSTATVAATLTATATPVTTALEGIVFSGEVATFTDSASLAPLSDFPLANVIIQWGDGSHSAATQVTQPGGVGTVFHVFGSHAYAEEGATAQPLRVTIQDVHGDVSNTTSYTPVVADAPLTNAGSTYSYPATAGVSLTNVPLAAFNDGNPLAPLADFSGTINWGDGTTTTFTKASGNVTQPGGVGTTFVVSGSHTYAVEGTEKITVTINDVGGSKLTVQDATVTVNAFTPFPQPLQTINSYEGTSWSYQLAGVFSDAVRWTPTNSFFGTINWGDGTTTTFTKTSGNVSLLYTDATASHYGVSGVHAYAEEGAYQITVTVNDSAGSSVTVQGTKTSVGDAPLSAHPVTVPSGTAIAGSSFTTTVAKFTDMDPNAVAQFTTENSAGQPGDYTATINWGDGTTSVVTNLTPQATIGNIVVDGSGFDVVGTHMYNPSSPTSFNVTVSIADVGGSKASVSTTILDPPKKTVKASASTNAAALLAVVGGASGSGSGSTSNTALNPAAVALLYGTSQG